MSLSHNSSVLDFFKSPSKIRVSPPLPLDTGDDNPDHLPIVQGKSLSNRIICLTFHTLYKFVINIKINL